LPSPVHRCLLPLLLVLLLQAGLLPSSPVAASCAMIPDDDEAGSPLQQIEADMELMLQVRAAWRRTTANAFGMLCLLDTAAQPPDTYIFEQVLCLLFIFLEPRPDEPALRASLIVSAALRAFLQELDLAAAARDLPAAVSWLRVAEGVGSLLDRDASCLVLEVPDFPGWRHSYDAAVGLRKQRLVRCTGRDRCTT
jgi:hypothetical protein